jgi:sugar/nucleoside kinase (ribokinase family)
MIGTIGDLVEDIVVRLGGPLNEASDTAADVVRRRGGSAANMAVSVVRCGHPARFIGQVGDDAAGAMLIETLRGEGVDVVARRGGRTGTIVVLLDHVGERSMLTDRGACTALDRPERSWLDGLSTVHVPVYSLVGEPLRSTTVTLVNWAHQRGITVSIDASSASVIDDFGADGLLDVLTTLRPTVLLCNDLEAEALGGDADLAEIGAGIVVVKRGARSALVTVAGAAAVEVPALPLTNVRDTTGAGDAFAAGFLVALAGRTSPVAAVSLAHQSAARAIEHASRS